MTTKLEDVVKGLISRNAKHEKKKRRINDQSWEVIIDHLYEEIQEFEISLLPAASPGNTIEELGDILGIVHHMILKAGFSVADVEAREIEKLKERYPETAQCPVCGYTANDAATHMDHRLCSNYGFFAGEK